MKGKGQERERNTSHVFIITLISGYLSIQDEVITTTHDLKLREMKRTCIYHIGKKSKHCVASTEMEKKKKLSQISVSHLCMVINPGSEMRIFWI